MSHMELDYDNAMDAIHHMRKHDFEAAVSKLEPKSSVRYSSSFGEIPEDMGDQVISFGV